MKIARLIAPMLCILFVTACSDKQKKQDPVVYKGPDAPEINTKYGWLNSDKSYSIKDFRGKIVLLDFWTFGCINCQHIIPDLEKLQKEFPNELVVIGIHSAKFISEKTSDRIQNAINKFGISHPVVNDGDYTVWNAYGVSSWPTVKLISPDGKIIFTLEGEEPYKVFKPRIEKIIRDSKDSINEQPIVFQTRKTTTTSILKFPSKIIAGDSASIWVTDSGNDRVINIDSSGKIIRIIGGGKEGYADGNFTSASFNEPQGLTLKGTILYIADSRNHSIRSANLITKQVTTVAGNGTMGYYYNNDQLNVTVLPNSPWDLCLDSNNLYIANAGNHQVLRMDLKDNKVFRFAGNGHEGITDGPLISASFSQPSGLTRSGEFLYDADPEASAIRRIDLKQKTVQTIAGKGLFKFGDKDGKLPDVLLQHCVGLTENDGKIYIADTYNGKIKILNLASRTITTLVSDLNEPNGVLIIGNDLWISDTNNNQLIKYGLKSGKKAIVNVRM